MSWYLTQISDRMSRLFFCCLLPLSHLYLAIVPLLFSSTQTPFLCAVLQEPSVHHQSGTTGPPSPWPKQYVCVHVYYNRRRIKDHHIRCVWTGIGQPVYISNVHLSGVNSILSPDSSCGSGSPGDPGPPGSSGFGSSMSPAAQFFRKCHQAGCTQFIFSEFASRLNTITERISSQQASEEGETE